MINNFIWVSDHTYSKICDIVRGKVPKQWRPRIQDIDGGGVIRGFWYTEIIFKLHVMQNNYLPLEDIHALCHLIWGRPCYPGPGSLTLVAPHEEADGKLSLVHDSGGLEILS